MEYMTEETAKEVKEAYLALLKQAVELSTNFNLKYENKDSSY